MNERAVPFYCPYCGEEDLAPVAEPPGAWRCAGCLRTFAVKFIGVGAVKGGLRDGARPPEAVSMNNPTYE